MLDGDLPGFVVFKEKSGNQQSKNSFVVITFVTTLDSSTSQSKIQFIGRNTGFYSQETIA
jgi:hypothetical protein